MKLRVATGGIARRAVADETVFRAWMRAGLALVEGELGVYDKRHRDAQPHGFRLFDVAMHARRPAR